jgi:outer membrane protein OmpA-like peptidoglycan-associated protein
VLSARFVGGRRARDEAEKPFWISFADLMSALMVLFLVVMSVALLSITRTLTEQEKSQVQHDMDIKQILDDFRESAAAFPGITIDTLRRVIDFGDRARFDFKSFLLQPEQARLLRAFIPRILERANSDVGKRILKRIVVEGFTDTTGTYLGNLNLSLQRSQRVLCVMFEKPLDAEPALTEGELQQIRDLFLVGGYSSNSARSTAEESRRVEMRLEFLGVGEARNSVDIARRDFGRCALGG